MMDYFKPTYLKQLCRTYGLTPSKQYGQNFLIQQTPIHKMIEAAELSAHDTVVEVGPGFGVLTLAMAPVVKKVVAFEIEKKLQPYWKEKQEQYSNIEMRWGNVLNTSSELLSVEQQYKVVANLPYQITSKVLRLFLEEVGQRPSLLVVMVQKEVAERICARPGDMSVLAVSVQYYGAVSLVTKVSRGCFWPAPQVDSAVIKITPHQDYASTPHDDERFFRVVKAGFANKRKQLWRNLTDGLGIPRERVQLLLQSIVGNEKVRAEELSVVQWRQVVEQVYHQNSPEKE